MSALISGYNFATVFLNIQFLTRLWQNTGFVVTKCQARSKKGEKLIYEEVS